MFIIFECNILQAHNFSIHISSSSSSYHHKQHHMWKVKRKSKKNSTLLIKFSWKFFAYSTALKWASIERWKFSTKLTTRLTECWFMRITRISLIMKAHQLCFFVFYFFFKCVCFADSDCLNNKVIFRYEKIFNASKFQPSKDEFFPFWKIHPHNFHEIFFFVGDKNHWDTHFTLLAEKFTFRPPLKSTRFSFQDIKSFPSSSHSLWSTSCKEISYIFLHNFPMSVEGCWNSDFKVYCFVKQFSLYSIVIHKEKFSSKKYL
jgi:hypothetical protein